MVILAQLVAKDTDSGGYITYVFKNLESTNASSKYIMCVRYPNWNHRQIKLRDKGYLTIEEVRAGIDTWYDGFKMIHYKYDAIRFIKFVPLEDEEDNEFTM